MTDRIKGVYVVFDRDYRTDDVEAILDAIKMIKGVSDITVNVNNFDDWINQSRIRTELSAKLWEVLHDTKEGS